MFVGNCHFLPFTSEIYPNNWNNWNKMTNRMNPPKFEGWKNSFLGILKFGWINKNTGEAILRSAVYKTKCRSKEEKFFSPRGPLANFHWPMKLLAKVYTCVYWSLLCVYECKLSATWVSVPQNRTNIFIGNFIDQWKFAKGTFAHFKTSNHLWIFTV